MCPFVKAPQTNLSHSKIHYEYITLCLLFLLPGKLFSWILLYGYIPALFHTSVGLHGRRSAKTDIYKYYLFELFYIFLIFQYHSYKEQDRYYLLLTISCDLTIPVEITLFCVTCNKALELLNSMCLNCTIYI